MKKPSDPSFIGSPMSYIARLPGSLSRIQHSIQKEMTINTREIMKAENAIKFEVEFDTTIEKIKINKNGKKQAATLGMNMLSDVIM